MESSREAAPTRFRLVGLAASAGGLSALSAVLSRLSVAFPLPITVVQHVDPNHISHVADILARRAALRVKAAEHGELLEPGVAYIAPPGKHMLVVGGAVQLVQGELVHWVKPSADRLFESIAREPVPAIGVILSGSGSDGADGVVAIKKAGGLVIAQDEESSDFFGMPEAAIATGAVDLILPLSDIAPKLEELAGAHRR